MTGPLAFVSRLGETALWAAIGAVVLGFLLKAVEAIQPKGRRGGR